MKIKFIESHSFVGECFSMNVNGIWHTLEPSRTITYEEQAVKILKDVHNIQYDIKDVKFVWDGSL